MEEFPYIFVRMVLPNATQESIRKVAELFFGKRKCCLEPDMAQKVAALFGTINKLIVLTFICVYLRILAFLFILKARESFVNDLHKQGS